MVVLPKENVTHCDDLVFEFYIVILANWGGLILAKKFESEKKMRLTFIVKVN